VVTTDTARQMQVLSTSEKRAGVHCVAVGEAVQRNWLSARAPCQQSAPWFSQELEPFARRVQRGALVDSQLTQRSNLSWGELATTGCSGAFEWASAPLRARWLVGSPASTYRCLLVAPEACFGLVLLAAVGWATIQGTEE
jgi:hypothetical protein